MIQSGENSVGFAAMGNQTHFPLNNKLLLIILDPRSYNVPAIKVLKDPEQVLNENKLQLYNATRFVISSNADFSVAKKIREEDETLQKPQERVILRKIVTSGKPILQIKSRMRAPVEDR